MTKNEYLQALRDALRIDDEESRNAAVLFCEEMIDDRIETGISEEEAVANMESPISVAARLNEEYEEMNEKDGKTADPLFDAENLRRLARSTADGITRFVQNMTAGMKDLFTEEDEAGTDEEQPEDTGNTETAEAVEIDETAEAVGSNVTDKAADADDAGEKAQPETERSEGFGDTLRRGLEKAGEELDRLLGTGPEAFCAKLEESADKFGNAFKKQASDFTREAEKVGKEIEKTLEKKLDEDQAKTDANEYRRMEYACDPDGLKEIALNADDFAVRVVPAEGEKVTLIYYTSDNDPYTVAREDGTLTLTHSDSEKKAFRFSFRALLSGKEWKKLIRTINNPIELLLPKDMTVSLSVSTRNGRISLADLQGITELSCNTSNGRILLERVKLGRLKAKSTNGSAELNEVYIAEDAWLETTNSAVVLKKTDTGALHASTSNGPVIAEELQCRDRAELITSNSPVTVKRIWTPSLLSVRSSNGGIDLREAEAERIEAGTSNSSIRFEQLRAAGYSFTSSNGSIGGTLPGELGDYAVQSGTSNGRNDLPAHSEGVIPLSVHTSNSSIRIGFAGKAEKTPEETGDSTEKSVD